MNLTVSTLLFPRGKGRDFVVFTSCLFLFLQERLQMRGTHASRQCLEDTQVEKVKHLNFRKFTFAGGDLIWFPFAQA